MSLIFKTNLPIDKYALATYDNEQYLMNIDNKHCLFFLENYIQVNSKDDHTFKFLAIDGNH